MAIFVLISAGFFCFVLLPFVCFLIFQTENKLKKKKIVCDRLSEERRSVIDLAVTSSTNNV